MIGINYILIPCLVVLGIWGLYQLKRDFSQRTFFKIGAWLFLIQGIANSYGVVVQFKVLPVWALISAIASNLFNYAIAYFFYWLVKNATASQGGAGTQLSPDEIAKFMEEGENDDDN